MNYLLDTNACIALINGRPPGVRERFRQAQQRGDTFAVSTVVLHELRYGVAKSQHPAASTARLEAFLLGEQFTAADVMVGSILGWSGFMGLLEGFPGLQAYVGRLTSRPAFKRANAD